MNVEKILTALGRHVNNGDELEFETLVAIESKLRAAEELAGRVENMASDFADAGDFENEVRLGIMLANYRAVSQETSIRAAGGVE